MPIVRFDNALLLADTLLDQWTQDEQPEVPRELPHREPIEEPTQEPDRYRPQRPPLQPVHPATPGPQEVPTELPEL